MLGQALLMELSAWGTDPARQPVLSPRPSRKLGSQLLRQRGSDGGFTAARVSLELTADGTVVTTEVPLAPSAVGCSRL